MSRPTDLELMMYFDGELDNDRREAVAKYLAESQQAAKKVRGLEVGGAMLALGASRSPAADGVADRVMAAIERDRPGDIELMMYFDGELDDERREVVEAHLAASSDAAAKVRGLALGSELLARHVAKTSVAADRVADAVMAVVAVEAAKQDELGIPSSATAAKSARASSTRPLPAANDNARRIYAAAALAVAAAAALLIWGKTASDTPPVATPTPTAEVAPVAANPAPTAVPSASASADDDTEPEAVHGVEVAAVEFGGKMGSIFYVPSGDTGSASNTTTVVWLADEAGDE